MFNYRLSNEAKEDLTLFIIMVSKLLGQYKQRNISISFLSISKESVDIHYRLKKQIRSKMDTVDVSVESTVFIIS